MDNQGKGRFLASDMKKPLIPYRYFMMFMIFMLPVITLSVRSIINVGILAMVQSSNATDSAIGSKVNFDWDQKDQGTILSAYYYTYTSIQIGGGLLTDKFNIVGLVAGANLIATICTLITPVAAKSSLLHLVGVRMVLGLIHGITFPSCYNLIAKWFLPTEVGLAQGLMAAGADVGSALVMPFTAWISQQGLWGGWPAAFYFVGTINLIFVIVWVFTVTKDPQSSKFVSDYELCQLSAISTVTPTNKRKKTIPWIKLVTSLPLWSVIITRGLMGLAYSLIYTKIPVYLSSVLGYDIENNGVINALFYIAVGISQIGSGPLARYIINRGWMPLTATRKFFEMIALFGIICSLLAVCYLGDHPYLIVACLVMAMFSYGFHMGGDGAIIPEMAPALIGTVYGFANTLGCATGFITPSFMGAILGDDPGSQSKWILAFQIMASLQVIAVILFGIFATAEPLSWADFDQDEIDDQPQPIVTISENVNNKTNLVKQQK